MTGLADPAAYAALPGALVLPGPAERSQLLRRHAAWSLWAGLAGAVAASVGAGPVLTAGLTLGAATLGAHPRQVALVPAFLVAALGGAALADLAGIAPVVGAGLGAGLAAGIVARDADDERPASDRWLDVVDMALAAGAGASVGALLGLVASVGLPFDLAGLVTGGLVGVGSGLALVLSSLSWQELPPGRHQVERALRPPWREPVTRAVGLYKELRAARPDREVLAGLGEVACWVYRIALSLQALDHEVQRLDPENVRARRLRALEEAMACEDGAVRDRLIATAEHLARLLDHAERVVAEVTRMRGLQDYALACLEEARVGVVLARALPGEGAPDRVDEVLERLRSQARAGEARRAAAREVEAVRAKRRAE